MKDKNGNPIYLTFVGSNYDEHPGWGLNFIYGDNGELIRFGRDFYENQKLSYFVNGQSFHSYTTLPEYYETADEVVDVALTLNSDGLVASMSVLFKLLYHSERKDDTYEHDYVLSYNSEKQLTNVEGSLYIENYDKDNNLEYAKVNESIVLTWQDGNLVKIDETYTEIEKVGNPDGGRSWTATIQYGNEPNAYKQFTKGLSDIRLFSGEYGIEKLLMLGLFGVGPSNLPTSIKTVNSKYSQYRSYTYTLNDKGLIASEKSSDSSVDDIYVYK